MKIDPVRMASLLGTWASGGGPLYERLADAIGAAIDRGELPAGAVLPTERDLASRVAVSRTTVVGAYGLLKESGRLQSRQGRGTWVAGGGQDAVPRERPFSTELYAGLLGAAGDLIELTAACPPPTSIVNETLIDFPMARLAEDTQGPGYLPGGLPLLRERLAEHMTGEGLPSRASETIVTTGAQQAIGLAATLLGAPGQSVLVEEATYPGALDILRGLGLRPIGVALDEGGVVPEALADLLERVRPAFVYLVPGYQNPTGSLLSAARSRRVAELSARYRVPIVEDLALRHLPMDERRQPPPIAAMGPDASSMVIGSLSKVFWGGLRVGWIRGSRTVVEQLMRLKIAADMGSPVMTQTIATELVPRFDAAIAERRAFLQDRYGVLAAALEEHLSDWSWDPPRGGCTVWARLPAGDARDFGQVAQRCGVSVVPGQVLSPDGGHADRLRLPFVHAPEVIEDAVRRLAAAWGLYAGQTARVAEPAAPLIV